MEVNERLAAIEKRLEKLEEAVGLLTQIAQAMAEGRVEGKSAKSRWLRRVAVNGRWFYFRGLGFPQKPKP